MRALVQRPRRVAGLVVAVVVAVSGLAVIGARSGYAASDAVVVEPPEGAGPPVAATGIGTKAALENPRCNTGKDYGPYGRWDGSAVGAGPTCVVPLEKGADNGGATSPGVTAKSIKVVAVLPSAAKSDRLALAAQLQNRASGTKGTWPDAVHDALVSYLPFYETWGRDIDVSFYTSTGVDETAQRADAVAIEAMKPFVVINFDTDGLDVLTASLAQNKILNESFGVSETEAEAQAPYRWAGNDFDAAALASAEVIGKNLVGKKAQYAGQELQGTTRKFGLVTIEDLINEDGFKKALGKYKGTIASSNSYASEGGTFGDAAQAQELAPTLVTRMKDAGITTVVLFSDVSVIKAMMQQASAQNWYPEWFTTGAGYWDLPLFTQDYPDEQAEHGFGVTLLPPYADVPEEVQKNTSGGPAGPFNWYFGAGQGTYSGGVPPLWTWFLAGIHNAGPKLTAKTFRQGLFADPGKPLASNLVFLNGYGRTTGLPYDAYGPGPANFATAWWDPHTGGKAIGGTGVIDVTAQGWYLHGAKRYALGEWPKNLKWFDKSNSIHIISEFPASQQPVPAAPCAPGLCPSSGSGELAGAPNTSGFVAKATPNAFAN